MRFSGLDGTNSMNGEITGLQRRLRHLSPHMKYINCQNDRLALVFVHLLKEFKGFQDVDQLLLNLWKMLKYSSVKFFVFEKAQESEGLTPLKILQCATTRWLSHGAATPRIISRLSPLVDAPDTIYFEKHDAEVKGVRYLLLRPSVILFLLLLADVLVHVNRFSRFLQSRSLVYTTIPRKLSQLTSNLEKLRNEEGYYMKQHGRSFLQISKERSELSRQTRRHGNGADVSIDETIESFKEKKMYPFFTALTDEISSATNMDDPEIKAFDVFNVHADIADSEREEKGIALSQFYGLPKTSNFQGDSNEAGAILSTDICDNETRLFFYEDFDLAKNEAAEK